MTAGVTFQPVVAPAALLVTALALAVAAWAYYRRREEAVTPLRQMVLFVMRIASLIIVVLALARPVWTVREAETRGNALAVVIDASGSMATRDADGRTRLDAAKDALGDALPRLASGYDVRVYSAAGDLERVRGNDVSGVVIRGDATALGEAIVEAAPRTTPAAVLLLSDGASNAGMPLSTAAEALAARGVKVFVVALGMPGAPNVAVKRILGPKVLFKDDPAAFFAEVSIEGGAVAPVAVTLKDGDRVVASADVLASGLVRLDFTPEREGEIAYTVEAAGLPNEGSTADNRATKTVRVTSENLAVLYVEREPRWEYRFLRNAMQRDKRFAVTTLLVEADTEVGAMEGNIAAFPSSREELFRYDCLAIGDVSPEIFAAAADNLRAFVSEGGGGVLFIAGPRHDPAAYLSGSLAEILPADYRAVETLTGEGWAFAPTEAGAANPALSLEDAGAVYSELPRIQWLVRLAPRMAATVLATAEPGELPLVVEQSFGRGRTVIVGTDELWRWRKKGGDRYLYRFWSQMVRYLGAKRFASQGAGEVTLPGEEFARGETIEATAYLEDGLGGALATPSARGYVEDDAGTRVDVTLTADPSARGIYRGAWEGRAPGKYRFVVVGPAGEASTPFLVRGGPLEGKGPSTDHAALAAAAAATGGAVLPVGRIADIFKLFPPEARTVTRVRATALAGSWWFLVPVAALLCAEWYLRKRWGLI